MQNQVPKFAIEFIRTLPSSQRVAFARAIEKDYVEGMSWDDAVAVAREGWIAGVRLSVRKDGSLRVL